MKLMVEFEQIMIKIEKSIVYLIIIFLVCAGIFKMFARNFLTSSYAINLSDGITSVIPHFVALLGFYGASLGLSRSEVIKIDITRLFLNEGLLRLISKISALVSAILIMVFIYLAYLSIEFGDRVWLILGYIPILLIIMYKSILRIFYNATE